MSTETRIAVSEGGQPLVPCRAIGPSTQVKASYQLAECNRLRGHPGRHQQRDPRTFALLGEWGDE